MDTQRKVEVLHSPDRLDSWKEIAAYLNRSERTVRRWEANEGLPVHRLQHDKRGSVYGYARELDAWRESRRQLVDAVPPAAASEPVPARRIGRGAAAGPIVVAVLAATAVGVWLARQPPPPYQPHPDAVQLVQRARFADNPGRVQIETAIRTYREAIRVDPMYSTAWSGLASAHLAVGWFGETRVADTIAQARKEADQALRLDPANGAAWRVRAFASHYFDYDHAAAERQFRKAIDLRPDAVAHSWYGDFLTGFRRLDEARRQYELAEKVAPRWLEPMTFAANLHYFAGHTDLALAGYEKVLAIEPNFGFAHHYRGRANLAAGRLDTAVAQLRKSDELLGHVPFSRADFGYALGIAGHRAEAEAMLTEMTAKRKAGYYPAFALSAVNLGLGRTEESLDWLEQAVEERHAGFYLPSVDPLFDAVRSHPRFQRLLRRMNLPM